MKLDMLHLLDTDEGTIPFEEASSEQITDLIDSLQKQVQFYQELRWWQRLFNWPPYMTESDR